ncbi:MAG: glycosyltransferase family 39 protein [Flavobacteriales bacterium]|nr:glycosyltransferase family 39 protein [Flavobacteriales bacterium]
MARTVIGLMNILKLGDLTLAQSLPFWSAFALMGASFLLYFKGRTNLGLTLLVLGSGGLGYAMAALDPFLWTWDEQYHALVAKNMLADPFRPVLVQHPIFGYDLRNWTFNHVWLHKQPLFLWQIALSIKIFGINELAVRLPSVLMHAIIPLFIFQMGKLAVSANTGYLAALFFAFASFPLELISGNHPTDHNDVAFLFYVTASCWAWFEFQRNRSMRWAMTIGLLAGCAIMVKWLAGLLVFGIWGIGVLAARNVRPLSWDTVRPILVALAICTAVALPWQFYIHQAFPEEAAHEYAMMHRHFDEAVEGHAGDLLFHFDTGLKRIYGAGDAVPWLLLIGLIVLFVRTQDRSYAFGMVAAIAAVYGFYTLAATKMVAFPLIVAPFIFLGLGALTDSVFSFIRNQFGRHVQQLLMLTASIAVCIMLLDMNMISGRHAMTYKGRHNEWRAKHIAQSNLTLLLEKSLPSGPHVLFNAATGHGGEIQTMFYTPHTAFGIMPTEEDVAKVKALLPDHPIVVMDKGQALPAYLTNDPEVTVIRWRY